MDLGSSLVFTMRLQLHGMQLAQKDTVLRRRMRNTSCTIGKGIGHTKLTTFLNSGLGSMGTIIRYPHHLPMLYKLLPPSSYNVNVPTVSAATVFEILVQLFTRILSPTGVKIATDVSSSVGRSTTTYSNLKNVGSVHTCQKHCIMFLTSF